jgi:hypothetical protein
MKSGSNNFFVRKVQSDHLQNLIVFKMTAHRLAHVRVKIRVLSASVKMSAPNVLAVKTPSGEDSTKKNFTHIKTLVKNSLLAQRAHSRA